MTDLIVCAGTGKGTWAEVYKLIEAESWGTIYIVTNSFGKEKFNAPENSKVIVLDEDKPITGNVVMLMKQFENIVSFNEIALNLTSGTGKQHMEILSSLFKLGANMRIVIPHNGKAEII